MRHILLFLLPLTIFISCQQPASAPVSENDLKPERNTISESPQPRDVDSLPLVQHSLYLESYDSLKISIRQRRIEFTQSYNIAKSDSARAAIEAEAAAYLLDILSSSVFPSWLGTTWAFEGYSNIPQQGEIACGYFVSTTLRHADFKLNRYKLAQAYSHRIAEVLGDRLQRFQDMEKMLDYIRQQPDDLFVVGLDNHVGFIEKHGDSIYFTHSSYWNPVEVTRQIAQDAPLLAASQVYVLSHVLSNKGLMQKWIKGENIPNP